MKTQKTKKQKTYRELAKVVRSFMAQLPEFNDPDEPVEGSEVVSVVCSYWDDFKRALKEGV